MPIILDAAGKELATLPANAVVMPILIGDSTAVGYEAANADVRGTLPGGATTLAYCQYWTKWKTATLLTYLDDVGNTWAAVTNAIGVTTGVTVGGAFIGPEFGLCYALRGRVGARMRDGLAPDVRLVKFGVSGARFHESGGTAAACWSPRRSGDTLYSLLRLHYLQPAIDNLLAAGKRVFIDGLYVSGGGNDGLAPSGVGYAGLNSFAASLRNLRETLASHMGMREIPMAFAKTAPFYNTSYTNIDDVRYQQEILAATTNAKMVTIDHLERNADGLHFTGQGALDAGLLLGQALSDYRWQEITAAP